MNMTVDQTVDFLTDSFPDIDKETLFLILQSNDYHLENTLEMLFTMESGDSRSTQPPPPQPLPSQQQNRLNYSPAAAATMTAASTSVNKRRGAQVVLPDDFLRVPGYSEKRREYVETGSLVNLLADPLFLQELEREFGPDYQSVLREHLQAEALRNTSDRAPYSDHPPQRPQQVILNEEAPRQFYVPRSAYSTSAPSQSHAIPYSHEYYNRSPPPYPHENVTVGPQQPPVLSHQSPPPPQSAPPNSRSWLTSPFSTSTNPPRQPTDQSREPMLGFGGGDSHESPTPRDDGPTSKFPPAPLHFSHLCFLVSERFQNILKGFASPFSDERREDNEAKRGLLSEDDEGEEGDNGNGIQMRAKGGSHLNRDDDSSVDL